MGFYGSYTLLLELPVLMHSCLNHASLICQYIVQKLRSLSYRSSTVTGLPSLIPRLSWGTGESLGMRLRFLAPHKKF